MAILNTTEWEAFLENHPDAHLLQTAAWGELKTAFGWQALRLAVGQAGAQVLLRHLPLGFSLAYIPRGPVGPNWSALWPEIAHICRQRRAILLKVEPDAWEPPSVGETARVPPAFFSPPAVGLLAGFIPSLQTIQPPRTMVVSLAGDEETLLERMKQKTRYNIRLAQKKEVTVRPSDDLTCFSDMMLVTAARDGFGVHSLEYYRTAYTLFHPQGKCELLLAEYAGQPLAAMMVFAHGKRAWYFYGASTDVERSRMPTYLLQWEAMRWARARGCSEYDLWGIPDASEADLEAGFEQRGDGLWGVYRFKRGFGGQVMRTIGAWDYPYQPLLYRLYRWWASRRSIG